MAILPTTTTTMRGKVGETAVAVSSVSSSSNGIARNHHHHHHHHHQHNPREESAREIVRRKRETFLAQMAVDVRKEEIDKLEKRAAQREEALRNAERMAVINISPFLRDDRGRRRGFGFGFGRLAARTLGLSFVGWRFDTHVLRFRK